MNSTSATSTVGSKQHLVPGMGANKKAAGKNASHDGREKAKVRTTARQPISSETRFSNGGDLAYRHEVTGAAPSKTRKNTRPDYRKQEQGDARQRIPSHAHFSNGGDLAYHHEVVVLKPSPCSLL